MPLYMDVHSLDGAVTFDDVGKAHQADLQTQGGYDVSYLRYWVDGSTERSSALSRLPTPISRRRFIARPMVSSLKRSTKCRRGHELLRTLAVASTSAVLLMGQAVAAFACEEHEPQR
jgi:hypothetical protein